MRPLPVTAAACARNATACPPSMPCLPWGLLPLSLTALAPVVELLASDVAPIMRDNKPAGTADTCPGANAVPDTTERIVAVRLTRAATAALLSRAPGAAARRAAFECGLLPRLADGGPMLGALARCRADMARLCGAESYPELCCRQLLAPGVLKVALFLQEAVGKLRPLADEQVARLLQRAGSDSNSSDNSSSSGSDRGSGGGGSTGGTGGDGGSGNSESFRAEATQGAESLAAAAGGEAYAGGEAGGLGVDPWDWEQLHEQVSGCLSECCHGADRAGFCLACFDAASGSGGSPVSHSLNTEKQRRPPNSLIRPGRHPQR
jgi:hypothetical protein